MKKMPEIGDCVTFGKTIGEADVYLFAGITGDLSPNHVNEEYMSKTPYKRRIAHGVLSLGFCSTTSSLMAAQVSSPCVSYGYDRVRFIKPLFIGDTVTVKYTVIEVDQDQLKSVSQVEVYNQSNELCTAAKHILKFFNEN